MITVGLLLQCLACIVVTVSADTQSSDDAVEVVEKHPGHLMDKRSGKDYVNDINDCAFMCSIVQTGGCRAYGFNAVFVTASWVLSNQNKVYDWTSGGERVKNIVVVSNTVDIFMDKNAPVHRVKKIFFTGNNGEFALLKTSGENHGFAGPVSSNWEWDVNMPMSIYHFDTYQQNIISHTNKMLAPSATCAAGPTALCIPEYDEDDVWSSKGAVMVDSNRKVVGLLYSASGGDDDYEWFDRVSALTPWIMQITTTM